MDSIDFNDLTKDEMARVKEFVILLKKIRKKTDTMNFTFNWGGGLKDAFNGKSSVDLQHESSNWR